MKKRIFAIVCLLIWLILIAPVVTPYIKTLFIHDGMPIEQVVAILGETEDIGSGTIILQWDMPLGQHYGVGFWMSKSGSFEVGNQFWLTPGNIPCWIIPAAMAIVTTALFSCAYFYLRKRFC